VASTKDISKFYQCVEADEAAQHVRRILWRFGERSREPTIFVTTRVNYDDRPAGCIAIAAVWEPASRFGEGKEEAAWFLKNQTYVDGATRGASSVEVAKQVSQDMEDILENRGFRFKETVMSGDPLGKDRELRKALGLRWDTQRDEICVDIKLNIIANGDLRAMTPSKGGGVAGQPCCLPTPGVHPGPGQTESQKIWHPSIYKSLILSFN
jgi:hypothetical protein